MLTSRSLRLLSLAGCLIAGLLILSACEMPTSTPAACEVGEAPYITVTNPALMSVIDDLTPTISWTIREGDCVPAQYKVEIWSAMTYPHGASAGYFLLSARSAGMSMRWPADAAPLAPGHTYYVYIKPMVFTGDEMVESGGTMGYFSTGPLCEVSDVIRAPTLRWPPDNWRLDPSGSMDFEWNSHMSCWPDHDFTIEFSTRADFSDIFLSMPDWPMEHLWLYSFMDLGWEECTRYFWHVKANMLAMDDEPFSDTRSFVAQPGDILCPLETGPVITPIPPMAILREAANCRSGPTTEYPTLDILPSGAELPIMARNRAGDSWLVADANIGDTCWVYGNLVEVVGDTGEIEIIDPQPPGGALPTETPITPFNCAQFNSNTCTGNNHPCKMSGGVCVNK